jgi:hypothetical protein
MRSSVRPDAVRPGGLEIRVGAEALGGCEVSPSGSDFGGQVGEQRGGGAAGWIEVVGSERLVMALEVYERCVAGVADELSRSPNWSDQM